MSITSKKSKKKALLAKLNQAIKAIEKLDAKLANSDDRAEQYAREQAGLIGEILIDNLVEADKDEDGKITHLTFKKHIEERIENCKQEYENKNKKARKDMLPTNWAIRSLLPIETSIEYPQIYWNRKSRYGYSIMEVLYNHSDWKGSDYREHVLEKGYSKLAKEGRKSHKGIDAEQDGDEEEDDLPNNKPSYSDESDTETDESDETDSEDNDSDTDADEAEDDNADDMDNSANNTVSRNRQYFKKLKPKFVWKTSEELPERYNGKIVIAKMHDDEVKILKTFPPEGTLTYPKTTK